MQSCCLAAFLSFKAHLGVHSVKRRMSRQDTAVASWRFNGGVLAQGAIRQPTGAVSMITLAKLERILHQPAALLAVLGAAPAAVSQGFLEVARLVYRAIDEDSFEVQLKVATANSVELQLTRVPTIDLGKSKYHLWGRSHSGSEPADMDLTVRHLQSSFPMVSQPDLRKLLLMVRKVSNRAYFWQRTVFHNHEEICGVIKDDLQRKVRHNKTLCQASLRTVHLTTIVLLQLLTHRCPHPHAFACN